LINKRALQFLSPLVLLACSQPQSRVIEPNAPASAGGGGGGDGVAVATTDNDQAFLFARQSKKNSDEMAANEFPIHLAEKWFPFRAEYLSLTTEQAVARDGAFPEAHGPEKFWDEQAAIEAVSIWSALCNECHGGRRRIKDALAMPPPPNGWGKGQGLFFGKRRAYYDIFKVISNGGPVRDGKPSEMIAWKQRLSKEQIWSLIYFLEFQSGGIEGTFPPSLYPRGS
jgi:hypothetical protein